ncbi:putative phosphatase PhoE [Bacillus sp. J14TS2]|uniref:histidine phosphatase family protein n=1 Tax=Bacillus sp. J14TS2 TaxID=2807188 RepID=UPI001B090F05|nr:histidine phosphatase family protein [Bacillus sp. J14TS2]GIN73894.1 putative phosphatase PhoE [Bacillus sp. J14TS2]
MRQICLVRHGETDWNAMGKIQGRTDISLNATGRRQAEECAQYFSNSEWDRIVTSPLKRAKQTASILNQSLQIPVIEMEDFVERCYGDAEGLTRVERQRLYPKGKNISNQEPRNLLAQRVMKGMQRIQEEYPNEKIILVAHGGVINTILAVLSNGEIGSGKTKLINACISNLHFMENQWNIQEYNQVHHLSQYNEYRGERNE